MLSDWRVLTSARRIAYADNAPLPNEKKADEICQELLSRGDISPAAGSAGVYIVTAPYANLLDVSEEQIVQEANPWAVFGFLTAMAYHGLTDLIPRQIYAIQFQGGQHPSRVPLGTTPEDWAEIKFPAPKELRKLGDTEIAWTGIQGKWEFGVEVGYSAGLPIYVTDVERTLLDALRMPAKCGGISKVLRAWRSAQGMSVDRLVDYTDRFGIQNLRQRVGYLLDTLGRPHPALKRWQSGLQRGGSVRLVAGEPYAESYSAEWNLSLNVPASVLAIIEAG